MPFNGTGIFQRVRSWVNDAANGIFVDATRMDSDTDDIAAGLSNCVTRDGQSSPTADLPMGTRKLTGLGNGAAATDSVNYGQVFNQPSFTAPSAVANAGLTAPPLRLATIGDLLTAAFQTALPAQLLGFLRSDGTNASFGTTHTGYAQNEVKGADIASAATINLTTATGNLVHVTGTTTITAITIPVGAERTVIFDGVLTLTNGAALLLPGAANIVTQAGDRALIRGDTAGAIVTHYQRADGTPVFNPPPTYALVAQATVTTAVANIDFLNLFTSAYSKYVIEIENCKPTTAANNLAIVLAVAGVPDTSGASYTALGVNTGNPAPGNQRVQLGTFPWATTAGGSLTLDVRSTAATAGYKTIEAQGAYLNSQSNYEVISGNALYLAQNAVTGFRLFWTAGSTFASATVRVYGVRNT